MSTDNASMSTDNAAQGVKYVPLLPDPHWDTTVKNYADYTLGTSAQSSAASQTTCESVSSGISKTKTPRWIVYDRPDNALRYWYHSGERTVIECPLAEHTRPAEGIVDETVVHMRYLWDAITGTSGLGAPASSPSSTDYELILCHEPQSHEVHYYFVEYSKEPRVFWLPGDKPAALRAPGVEGTDGIGDLLHFQFWAHVARFPGHRDLPDDVPWAMNLHAQLAYEYTSSVSFSFDGMQPIALEDGPEGRITAEKALDLFKAMAKETLKKVCLAHLWKYAASQGARRHGISLSQLRGGEHAPTMSILGIVQIIRQFFTANNQ